MFASDHRDVKPMCYRKQHLYQYIHYMWISNTPIYHWCMYLLCSHLLCVLITCTLYCTRHEWGQFRTEWLRWLRHRLVCHCFYCDFGTNSQLNCGKNTLVEKRGILRISNNFICIRQTFRENIMEVIYIYVYLRKPKTRSEIITCVCVFPHILCQQCTCICNVSKGFQSCFVFVDVWFRL